MAVVRVRGGVYMLGRPGRTLELLFGCVFWRGANVCVLQLKVGFMGGGGGCLRMCRSSSTERSRGVEERAVGQNAYVWLPPDGLVRPWARSCPHASLPAYAPLPRDAQITHIYPH